MNYFIAFIAEDEFEWCVMESTDFDYISKIYESMSAPPGYNTELRATEEDIETYRTYEVLRYDYSQFLPNKKYPQDFRDDIREELSNSMMDIFAKVQGKVGIESGDIEPLMALDLDGVMEKLIDKMIEVMDFQMIEEKE